MRQRKTIQFRSPLSNWDRTPSGLRAALIMTPILFALFLMNGIGISVFSTSGIGAGMVCYPVQILAYGFNGFLAGMLGRATNKKANQKVGTDRIYNRQRHPNYLAQGALAGMTLGLVAILIYIALGTSASTLIPGVGVFLSIGAPSIILFMIVDFFVSVGAGILGGLIYGQVS